MTTKRKKANITGFFFQNNIWKMCDGEEIEEQYVLEEFRNIKQTNPSFIVVDVIYRLIIR